MTLSFLYKCRRCGAVQRVSEDEEMSFLKACEILVEPTSRWVHECEPNRAAGISDLIGFEPDPELPLP